MDINETLRLHADWLNSGGTRGNKANLSGARLSGANLSEADLSGASLYGADLSGANLHGFIPLYADTNRRYVLYVIEANQPMFIAGCRCFTLTEAIEHWGRINPNPPYIKAISDYMETRKST